MNSQPISATALTVLQEKSFQKAPTLKKSLEKPLENPKGIIIHAMGEWICDEHGHYLSAREWLHKLGLSVHALIHPQGKIVQLVDVHFQAHHAGKSYFPPWHNLNEHFLGIELLIKGCYNNDQLIQSMQHADAYSSFQYASLAKVCAKWQQQFSIDETHIVGHAEVSGEAVRGKDEAKHDPGDGFDWSLFRTLLRQAHQQKPFCS